MNKFLALAFAAIAFSSAAYAADSTSMTGDNDVTPQSIGGGGGPMTGPQLFEATKGKSTTGGYTVGTDGILYLTNAGGTNAVKSKSGPCNISSGSCNGVPAVCGSMCTPVPPVYTLSPGGLILQGGNGGSTSVQLWR